MLPYAKHYDDDAESEDNDESDGDDDNDDGCSGDFNIFVQYLYVF